MYIYPGIYLQKIVSTATKVLEKNILHIKRQVKIQLRRLPKKNIAVSKNSMVSDVLNEMGVINTLLVKKMNDTGLDQIKEFKPA